MAKALDEPRNVELELQQFLSALEKHHKREDGRSLNQRQASGAFQIIYFLVGEIVL